MTSSGLHRDDIIFKLNDIAKVLGEKEITLGEVLINNFDKIGKDEKKLNLEGFQSLLVEI